MTAPNNTDARLTVIEHYLAIMIDGQLSLHDDALAQLEAEDLGWQAQLAGRRSRNPCAVCCARLDTTAETDRIRDCDASGWP